MPKASIVGSNGGQPQFTLLALTFSSMTLNNHHFLSLYLPAHKLGIAREPTLQGFCKSRMGVVSLSAGTDEEWCVLIDGDRSCPSRNKRGWLVFWSRWTIFESLPSVLFFSAFFSSPESHPGGHRKEGFPLLEKNSPHLSRFCGEHKTTSTLLTDEV